MKYENITNVFRITNGYEGKGFNDRAQRFTFDGSLGQSKLIPDKEGKPSIARRYKYIPENMQQKVVDKYFDFHKGSWSSDDKALNKTRFLKVILVSIVQIKLASVKQSSLLVSSMAILVSDFHRMNSH